MKICETKFGFKIAVREDDRDMAHFFLQGIDYEPHVVRRMLPFLQAGVSFVDVGANIGFFSLLAASRLCAVAAFEPNPYGRDLLGISCEANGFSNIVRFSCGASDRDGDSRLNHLGSNGEVANDGIIPIKLRKLDDYSLTPNMLKLDCEGHEWRAAAGMRQTLQRFHPHVFTEFYPRLLVQQGLARPEEYLEFWEKLGYRFHVLDKVTQENIQCGSIRQVMGLFAEAEKIETYHIAYLDLYLEP